MTPGQQIDMKRRVASNVDLAIRQADLTTAQVARALKGHERTVSRWRSASTAPSHDSLSELAVVVGKPVDWFYMDHAPLKEAA